MFENEDTQDTKEGEASHWVVSQTLSMTMEKLVIPNWVGFEAPNGVILDDEMVECAQVMIDDVLEHVALPTDLHVEQLMPIPRIHKQCFGTPDVWMFNGTIFIWDYKYGHKDVQPDSWQNVCYLAGILDQRGINGYDEQHTPVVMTIVQPRSFSSEGPIKRYKCKASDLRNRINLLASQAERAFLPDPGVSSGPHCRYCPARHSCAAARNAASAAVDYAGSAMPEVLTTDAISFELALLQRAMKAMEYRYDAIKTLALTKIDSGETIPGYGFKNGLGHRKFTAPPDEIFAMGDILGIETRAPLVTISPAEFDRRLKTINKERKAASQELIDKSVINAYVDRPSTGKQLVPSTETLAIKAFTL